MSDDQTLLEDLGDWRRSHTCGELRNSHVGSTVTLMGWVHRTRDHGGVLFVDLRDRHGITQIVFHPETGGRELLQRGELLGNEFVVAVRGPVTMRPAESVNADLATGGIELDVRELKVLASSAPLPFQINEEKHLANEDLRLRYRYLDLRRPDLSSALALRHRAAQAARAHLSGLGFLEIETPMLVRPTPEGARDFYVPSRVFEGRIFALPQSPQLYKQTLMISGMDRYFQLARCMRDEDLRADRQPEHTQIDLEMSFVREDDVFDTVESLMAAIWKECRGIELKRPFPRMTFDESMRRYGSDKPDVRFGLELIDVTQISSQSPRRVIADGAKAPGGIAVAIQIPGGAEISGTQFRKYEEVVKAAGAGGLTFFKVQDADREKQQVIFPGDLLDLFYQRVGAKKGDAVVFTNGPWEQTCKALGVLRSQLGAPLLNGERFCGLEPVDASRWEFLWVREFPMFEPDADRKGWAPRHHMFTMPNPEHLDFLETDPGKVYAQLYDLVLNGNELGSGSIRIHRPDIQERVMRVVGIPLAEAHDRFGFLLRAYHFASPPHGGIGLGFDRIAMLLIGAQSIRDVIAFPRSASSANLMDDSPSDPYDAEQRAFFLSAARHMQVPERPRSADATSDLVKSAMTPISIMLLAPGDAQALADEIRDRLQSNGTIAYVLSVDDHPHNLVRDVESLKSGARLVGVVAPASALQSQFGQHIRALSQSILMSDPQLAFVLVGVDAAGFGLQEGERIRSFQAGKALAMSAAEWLEETMRNNLESV